MVQLYFLSIVFNGLIGLLFIFGDIGKKPVESTAKFSFAGDSFRLVMGILAVVTGIIKLLSPMRREHGLGIPILGDFIPAVAGIIAGFMLIYSFYRERSPEADSEEKSNSFGEVLLRHKRIAGIALLAFAALHFFFPEALFL
jgi:uncharacterized membrane protein HdeD (DUF308 family)